MVPRQRQTKMLSQALVTALSGDGFEPNAPFIFTRQRGELLDVITISFVSADKTLFWVSYGVDCPNLAPALSASRPQTSGWLSEPLHSQRAYAPAMDSPDPASVAGVVRDLKLEAYPWFLGFKTPADVAERYREKWIKAMEPPTGQEQLPTTWIVYGLML